MPQQPVTRELFERADQEFEEAKTVEDVRDTFKRFYQKLGYKRLCKLFVFQYGVDELWLAEVERVKKGAKTE